MTPKKASFFFFCMSFLRRGHANLLCIVPILVYVLLKQAPFFFISECYELKFALISNSYAKVLAPSTSECDLISK